jgi:hypothetical protein
MRWVTAVVGLLLAGSVAAAGNTPDDGAAMDEAGGLGEIVSTEGRVRLVPGGGFRKEPAKPGHALGAGDLVLTAEHAGAVLAFRDGSRVAMDATTKLEVVDPGELRQSGGRALYRVQSGSAEGRKVRTEFSVIGVKGTEFLVSDTGDAKAVAMAEGEVAIEAPEGAFKLYREKQTDAFESFKERQQQGVETMRQEFEAYKRQVRREFVDYVRSFSLGSGKMATFGDGEATTGEVSDDMQEAIQRLRERL